MSKCLYSKGFSSTRVFSSTLINKFFGLIIN